MHANAFSQVTVDLAHVFDVTDLCFHIILSHTVYLQMKAPNKKYIFLFYSCVLHVLHIRHSLPVPQPVSGGLFNSQGCPYNSYKCGAFLSLRYQQIIAELYLTITIRES